MLLLQGARKKPTVLPPHIFLVESNLLIKNDVDKNYIEFLNL